MGFANEHHLSLPLFLPPPRHGLPSQVVVERGHDERVHDVDAGQEQPGRVQLVHSDCGVEQREGEVDLAEEQVAGGAEQKADLIILKYCELVELHSKYFSQMYCWSNQLI